MFQLEMNAGCFPKQHNLRKKCGVFAVQREINSYVCWLEAQAF